MKNKEEEKLPSEVTDIAAAKDNIDAAVQAFAERWLPMPNLTEQCEAMDQGQLRDAMGLYATIDLGDPWPQAENLLLKMGFHWHSLGGSRVMFLMEREDVIDVGWNQAEEVNSEKPKAT